MNRKQVYKELKEQWKLFDMTDKEIECAYNTITGLDKTKEQTMLDLKEYLLEYVLDQMIKDDDLDQILAGEILEEILEKWKR